MVRVVPRLLRQKRAALAVIREADRQMLHLVRDLLDEAYYRLADATLLERDDLRESLQQMATGQGIVRVPKAGREGLRQEADCRDAQEPGN